MASRRSMPVFLAVLLLIMFSSLSGCASYGKVILEDDTGAVTIEVDQGSGDRYYESRLPEIPPGHMPPPGLCRIWIPGKPPGQQSPPGDCWELKRQLPSGAWLIRGE